MKCIEIRPEFHNTRKNLMRSVDLFNIEIGIMVSFSLGSLYNDFMSYLPIISLKKIISTYFDSTYYLSTNK